jgi:hypothetical protein
MIGVVLLALAAPLSATEPVAPGAWFSGDSPIEIWASRTHGLRHGDRVRLYTRSERDGYLVVLHAEPSGRVRVLFPLDPLEDNYLRGRISYELRGRGGSEAFEIFDRSGYGTVLAAFSRDPFRFDSFMRGDHWDYTQLDLWRVSGDPEGHLLGLVDRMATGRYDYDILRYDVVDYVAYRSRPVRLSLYGAYLDGDYHGGVRVSVYLGAPWFYYPPYYRPVFVYPVPVYYYGPYYYAPPVLVYDPFFDPYFPYYRYRPAYYPVYLPSYYAYYAAYYPVYRHRTVPIRYAGGYTFKAGSAGSQPSVVEPRGRPVLAEAVTRRLVAPDNFSPAAGSSIRRAVVSDRAVTRPTEALGSRMRYAVGEVSPRGAQPVSGAQAEPRRREMAIERAPATGGEVPRRVEPRELDGRRSLGGEARSPVPPASSDRSSSQMDRLRRLVPQARERADEPPRPQGLQVPRRGATEDRPVGEPARPLTGAVPDEPRDDRPLIRREIRYNPPLPAPAGRESGVVDERMRRAVPPTGEPQAEVNRTEYPPPRAVPQRETGSSARIVPRRAGEAVASPGSFSSPYRIPAPVERPPGVQGAESPRGFPVPPRTLERSPSPPAVAAPLRVPRVLVPGAAPAPQREEPMEASARRKP